MENGEWRMENGEWGMGNDFEICRLIRRFTHSPIRYFELLWFRGKIPLVTRPCSSVG